MRDKLIAVDWGKDATKVRTRCEWLLGWGRGWDAAERHYRAATPTDSTPPTHSATATQLELLLDRAQEQLKHNRHKHNDSREGRDRCLKCRIRAALARAATKVETSHEMLMRETFEVEGGKLALYLNTVERLLGHSPAPAQQKEER